MKTSMLDDMEFIRKTDPAGLLGLYLDFHNQCSEALRIGGGFLDSCPEEKYSRFKNVIICGIGGSGIGGDVLRCVLQADFPYPVSVNRGYDIPGWVDSDTLAFVVSYSGGTEETLTAFDSLLTRTKKVIAVSSGGALMKKCVEKGIDFIQVPGGLPPRSTLGYLFLPVFMAVCAFSGRSWEIHAGGLPQLMKALAGEYDPLVPCESNYAKKAALALKNRVPVIYSASPPTEAAAIRWKGQINENSKAPAVYSFFPEMNHNEIVGWEAPGSLTSAFTAVYLRDGGDRRENIKRMDIVKDILLKKNIGVFEITARGGTPLERLFSLIYAGDIISIYLALLYGADPYPVGIIEYLKKRLAEEKGSK